LQDEFRIPKNKIEQVAEQYVGSDAAIEAKRYYRPIYEVLDEHLNVTLRIYQKIGSSLMQPSKLIGLMPSGSLICSAQECLPKVMSQRTRSANCGISSVLARDPADERTAEKNRV
jgi:hypothetical protein